MVLAGRERTVSKDGKVVLLLHGATVPGFVAFDLDHEQCSLMRYLARAMEVVAHQPGRYAYALRYTFAGKRLREQRDRPLQTLDM
jgi:hypothetical protein